MISALHLRNYVIIPVLEHLGLNSLAAQNLLLGTAAVESEMGTYLVQRGGGPALGIWQCEPATHNDLWQRWVPSHGELGKKLEDYLIPGLPRDRQLVGNLYYGAAIARLIYYRHPMPLPDADDVHGLAHMWKVVWNTSAGKGTPEKFVKAFTRCVGPM